MLTGIFFGRTDDNSPIRNITLPQKMKRSFSRFIGFIGVVALLSAGASGYFFHRHTQNVLQHYAFMIKSQALMLRERGNQLKDLSQDISSDAKSASSLQQAASGDQGNELQKYAAEIRDQALELERYAAQTIDDVQSENPEGALATAADAQLFIPENLKMIKKQRSKIDELEKAALRYRSRIQQLRIQLDDCMVRPDYQRPSPYNRGYLQDQQGPGSSSP